MKKNRKISGGVYLVLNPAMDRRVLLKKLTLALEGGVSLLQIWNHWPMSYDLSDKLSLIRDIETISSTYPIQVLINEEWELLPYTDLSGVHFDNIPPNYAHIKSMVKRDFISGITCSNDLEVVHWAEQNNLDYISFCAMFPSSSVHSCELVQPATIQKARVITQIPFFLSGGITAENLLSLKAIDFSGIALISGILSAEDPKKSTIAYKQVLQMLQS